MNLKPIAANMVEVRINDKTVLFSYQTPVAYTTEEKDGVRRYYKTARYWSKTTDRHINKGLGLYGRTSVDEIVTQDVLDNLVK